MEVSEGKGLSFNGIRNFPDIKKFSMKPCQHSHETLPQYTVQETSYPESLGSGSQSARDFFDFLVLRLCASRVSELSGALG